MSPEPPPDPTAGAAAAAGFGLNFSAYDFESFFTADAGGRGVNNQILKSGDYLADLDYYVDVYAQSEIESLETERAAADAAAAESWANEANYTGVELGLEFENDDSAWIMACVFIIFTMQTGIEKKVD